MWLKIYLLIVLFAGQALGQLTSTTPSNTATSTTAAQTSAGEASAAPSFSASSTFPTSTTTAASDSQPSSASSFPLTTTTTAQTTVYYFLDVNVDVIGPRKNESEIIHWLELVFRNQLEHCLYPYTGTTTIATTSTQMVNVTEQVATPQTYNSTTPAFSTLLQNNSATTNATTLNVNNITAATTLNGNNTTAATVLNGNNTATYVTLNSTSTTTAATTLNGNSTATYVTSNSTNTTTAATTSNGNNMTAATVLNGNSTATYVTLNSTNTITAATTLNGNNTATYVTSNSSSTTTAATMLNGNSTATYVTSNSTNTTTAATTSNGNNMTAATVLNGNNTATYVTLNSTNTTTAARTLNGNNTTTDVTMLNGNNTTGATTLNGNNTARSVTLNSANKTRAVTTLSGNNTTTTVKPLIGNNTTETMLSGNITTTAAATPKTGNITQTSEAVLHSNTTATAETTALNDNTTLKISKPSRSSTTVTATQTTTFDGNRTPTVATTTASKTNSTPTTPTTTAPQGNSLATTTPTSILPSSTLSISLTTFLTNTHVTTQQPNPQDMRRKRAAREVSDNVIQNSNEATLLFQGIEVSCSIKTEINQTKCTIMLGLSHKIPSCCILQTLCAASKNSSDIHVVGKRADEKNPLQCNVNSNKPNSCIYSGPLGASCVKSGAEYVIPPSNLTGCGTENSCSCSSYCNKTDAYYTFSISLQDRAINTSFVSAMVSALAQPPNCSIGINATCPLLAVIASEYRSASVDCEKTETECRVILGFTREVPLCSVAEAVSNVFLLEDNIYYDGHVNRAAICGSADVSASSLNFQFSYNKTELTPAKFCMKIEESDLLKCETGKNLVVHLNEQCVVSTTTSPNVTRSPNVTSLNTTTSPNVTISPNVTSLNTTTSPNVTSLNTTTSPNVTSLNITTSPNVTSLNITTSPNVTSLNITTSPNVTSLNTTTDPNLTIGPNVTANNVTTAKPTVQSNNTLTPTTTPNTQQNTTRSPSITTSGAGGEPSSNTTRTTTTTSVSSASNGTAESQARELLALTQDVSNLTTAQIENLVSQLEKLLSGPNVSKELGEISVNIVSNLLDASADKLSSSSERIIGIVDTVGLKLVIEDTAESLLYPSLAVSVKPADGTNFKETVFSILDPSNVQVRGNLRFKRSALKDSSIPQGSITLPPSLTQNLTSEEKQLVSRVQFNFYQKSTVFQDVSLRKRRLNSGILGASVANLSIKGLQDSVVIRLRHTEPVPANFVAVCVFWDFTLNKGSGGWNSDGCFVKDTTDNETVCGCNHLTSFAILLDIYRETLTSRLQATILTFITYIGCGLSAIFLSITLLTYLAFGKLRKDIPSKILIQLCLALLLLNLVFLVDAWLALYPEAVGLCISTAWFLHYFLLASFTWMGLEGVNMYYALVKVFNDNMSHYMLKFSLVGWGVPMIVVIIVIAIDKDNYGLVSYGRFPDGTSDDFCWITNDIAFYVAVVAYFCVIFIFNVIMFIVVLVQLHRIKKQNPHNNKHRSTLQDVRSVIGITLLLGLTWGFAFFAWGPVNLAFMYLFAIFNSLQGFFIFLFHCAVKETVRKQWRIYLCCGRMRLAENSEWSRTATQKTKKSPLSSSQGSRPSSSSFLPRTPSGQMSGIGNPLEDRIITADEERRTDVVLNEINRQLRSRRGS